MGCGWGQHREPGDVPSSCSQPWGLTGEGLVPRYPFGGVCLFTFLPVLFTDSFLHIPDRMRISAGALFLLLLLSEGRVCGGWDLEEELLREDRDAGYSSSFWNLCFPSLACTASSDTANHGSLISFFPVIPKCTFINFLIVTRESLVQLMFQKWVLYRGIATRGGNTGSTLDLPSTGWLWDHLTTWLLTELRQRPK